MFFKKEQWVNESRRIRGLREEATRTIIQELRKPGLLSTERDTLADMLAKNRSDTIQWEELNERMAMDFGESIGYIKGVATCVGGFVCGALIAIVKNKLDS